MYTNPHTLHSIPTRRSSYLGYLAHREPRLRVRERGAKDVRRAHRSSDRIGAGIRNDEQRVVVPRRLRHRDRKDRKSTRLNSTRENLVCSLLVVKNNNKT